MSLFREHILDPVKEGMKEPDKGIPIPMPKLSKYTDYIERGKVIVIGGKPTSGKTSFMDHMYFMNVFRWWKEFEYEKDAKGRAVLDEQGKPVINENAPEKPPLKMFYFNMRSSPRIKLQKWLCLYLKIQFNTTIDIATLNSGVGRLYNLNEAHAAQIAMALEFFEYMENEVLTLISGSQTPTTIYNKVHNHMHEVGSVDETGTYHLKPENTGMITMLYVDNVDYMLSESDQFGPLSDEGIKKKIASYVEELKVKYGVTSVLVAPSKATYSRVPKDSEPSYKELGVFQRADIGLITYNPYNENNKNYGNYPTDELVISGKNRLRTITLVKNSKGQEGLTVGAIFIGECGFFREAEHPSNEGWFASMIDKLLKLP